HRLREQHERDAEAVSAAVERGGECVVRADGANGDEALDAAALRVGEDELELADLVAAVRLRAEVVPLDPELRALRGRAEVERLDGRGELADRQPRDARGQL